MATTNPAERLLKAVRLYRAEARKNHNHSVGSCWAAILDCDAGDTLRIYTALAGLLDVANDVELTIKKISGINHDKYLSCFPIMKKSLTPRALDNGCNERSFDGEIEARLENCAEVLNSEVVLDAKTLDELKLLIDDLSDDIREAEISPSLRLILLDLAESMRRSIVQYDIRGVKGMKQAFGHMIVELGLHHSEIKSAPNGSWKEKLVTVWNQYSKAISTAANTTKVIEFSPKALEIIYQALPFLK